MRSSGASGVWLTALALGCAAAPSTAPAPRLTSADIARRQARPSVSFSHVHTALVLGPAARRIVPAVPVAPLAPPRRELTGAKPLRVALHVRGVEPKELIAELSKQLDRSIAVGPGVRTRVTIDLDDATPRFALERVGFALHAELTALPGGTLFYERFRIPRLPFGGAAMLPVRTLLELLAARAGTALLVDDEIDGAWTGALPEGDPARALALVVARARLHATRFGNLVVVAPRPLVAGDSDLDPDKDWREGLTPSPVELDTHDPSLTDLLAAASRVAHRPIGFAFQPSSGRLAAISGRVPWTDLVSLAARIERARVRRDGPGLLLEPIAGQALAATLAPANALLSLLADSAGKHIVACPRLRGTFTVPIRSVAPENALAGLAALEGLVVLPVAGESVIALVPMGARRLESLVVAPTFDGARLPDGRLVDLHLEAVVVNNRRGNPAVLLSGRALHLDDEIVLPGAPSGEVARLTDIGGNRCTLEISGPNVVDGSAPIALVLPNP